MAPLRHSPCISNAHAVAPPLRHAACMASPAIVATFELRSLTLTLMLAQLAVWRCNHRLRSFHSQGLRSAPHARKARFY